MFSNVNQSLDSMDGSSPAIPGSMDTQGKRVKWALKQSGKKATDLANYLGISRSAVSQWWQVVNPTSPSRHLPKVAEFLGFSEQWLRNGTGLPVRESTTLPARPPSGLMSDTEHTTIFTLGEVAAGMFLSVTEVNDLSFEREPSVFPPLPEYSVDKQYDLIVRGTSIDRFARDGERVRCVSLQTSIQLQSGDYVHVERYRRQRSEIENTIKRAFFVNGRWELRFDSNDPRWKGQPPLVLGTAEDEQVEVVGIAIFQFFPAPARRRL